MAYARYKTLTVDSSKIDADLTHFPVAIPLGTSVGLTSADVTDIFDEVGSDYLKIAVTMADGTTQLYVEVEEWDAVSERALLWVSRDTWTISSTSDTEIRLYFDSGEADNTTYIGDPGDAAAQNVWNSNFVARYGMSQDPSGGVDCIIDSTVNANHGTPQGSMTSGDLIDGTIGKAIEFDGSDDCIVTNFTSYPNELSFIYTYASTAVGEAYHGWRDGTPRVQIRHNTLNAGEISPMLRDGTDKTLEGVASIGSALTDGEFHRLLVYFNQADDEIVVWFDGISKSIAYENQQTPTLGVSNGMAWGARYRPDSGGVTDYEFEGAMQHVCIINTLPSDAWIKADYHTQTDSLLTYSGTITPSIELSLTQLNMGINLNIGNIIGDAHTTLSPLEMGMTFDGSPMVSMPATAFSMGIGMDMGEIRLGVNVAFEPLNLGISLDFGNVTQNIALLPMEMGLVFDGSPMQSIPLQPFEIGLSMDFGDISTFETGSAIIRYFCILTGAADGTTDLTLPMASFQARRRSGDPTYLSVVIPTVDYAAQIAARPNGTLKIRQAYEQNGVIKQTETIMETSLDEVNPDEGGTNQSTTLVGYSTSTYSAKAVTLSGVTYRSTRAGKYHYRLARPYIFLNPGDTVTFSDDGVSFVIDTMSYFINPTTSTIELAST